STSSSSWRRGRSTTSTRALPIARPPRPLRRHRPLNRRPARLPAAPAERRTRGRRHSSRKRHDGANRYPAGPPVSGRRTCTKVAPVRPCRLVRRGSGPVLSIGKLAPGRADYYLDTVARGAEEYYVGSGEAPGRWLGRGAERLGLTGDVA